MYSQPIYLTHELILWMHFWLHAYHITKGWVDFNGESAMKSPRWHRVSNLWHSDLDPLRIYVFIKACHVTSSSGKQKLAFPRRRKKSGFVWRWQLASICWIVVQTLAAFSFSCSKWSNSVIVEKVIEEKPNNSTISKICWLTRPLE